MTVVGLAMRSSYPPILPAITTFRMELFCSSFPVVNSFIPSDMRLCIASKNVQSSKLAPLKGLRRLPFLYCDVGWLKLLVQLVQRYGAKNWARIAEKLPMRIGKQCRERWQNYLRPNIMKNEWSEEEDKLLISLHQQFGNKWADLARRMPGRTENNIKNHWNATKRRQFSSKNRKKTKNPSLLKDYITSITSSPHNHQIDIQQPPPVVDPTSDSGVGYKPAEVALDESGFDFDYDDVSSRLVDELVFDPTKEMDFLKLLCQ